MKTGTEERGENPRRRNGTVSAKNAPSAGRSHSTNGWGRRERVCGESHTAQVRIFGSRGFGGFPAGRYAVHKQVCTKAKKALVLFYGGKQAIEYKRQSARSILYLVKNDKSCNAAIAACIG